MWAVGVTLSPDDYYNTYWTLFQALLENVRFT